MANENHKFKQGNLYIDPEYGVIEYESVFNKLCGFAYAILNLKQQLIVVVHDRLQPYMSKK